MNDIGYVFIPISLAILAEFFVPYLTTLHSRATWFSPPVLFNSLFFLGKYILLGFIIYKNKEIEKTNIEIFAWISVFLNLAWSYFINRNDKYALIFLFISLVFAYLLYNEVFLSDFSKNDETLYINLLSVYIIWIGFMITSVYQMGSKKHLK